MYAEIKRRNNLNGMNDEIFYCGVWALNEPRTKIIKALKMFKNLFGINSACYIHDKHYNYLFSQLSKIGLLKFLWFKIFIDTLFLTNCFKYAYKNDKSTIKYTHRLILSCVFYIIVILATPVYLFMYRNS
jgi:hypothetical protein